MRFDGADQLEAHQHECAFRPFACPHTGCAATFSAHLFTAHDAKCPFKLLQCPLVCPPFRRNHRVVGRERSTHLLHAGHVESIGCRWLR